MTFLANIIKLVIITGILYIIYKTGIIEKIYIKVNKIIGLSDEEKAKRRKKEKYVTRLLKNYNRSDEL